jgi:hypothetical protein
MKKGAILRAMAVWLCIGLGGAVAEEAGGPFPLDSSATLDPHFSEGGDSRPVGSQGR